MTVIKINAITVPEDAGDELARRFAARAHAVDDQDGFEGFELLDVFGPLEAWGIHAESDGACTIVMAAEKAGAVKSAQGPCAIADCALNDCPRIDVILVPGGIGTRREVNADLVLGDHSLSILEGVVLPWGEPSGYLRKVVLPALAKAYKFDLNAPWSDLSPAVQKILLRGAPGKRRPARPGRAPVWSPGRGNRWPLGGPVFLRWGCWRSPRFSWLLLPRARSSC